MHFKVIHVVLQGTRHGVHKLCCRTKFLMTAGEFFILGHCLEAISKTPSIRSIYSILRFTFLCSVFFLKTFIIFLIAHKGVFRRIRSFFQASTSISLERERERDELILYPNIFRCLHACVISISRKVFIVMLRLKTYLRSTMSSERLSSLALLYIYRNDFPFDLDKVISEFVSRKERSLSFLF